MNIKSLLTTTVLASACLTAWAEFPEISLYPVPGTPFSSVDNMATFNITTQGITVEGSPIATFESLSDGDQVQSTDFYYWDMAEATLIKFNTADFKINGDWELTIPKGALSYKGETNPTDLKYVYKLNDKNLDTSTYPQITLESIDPANGAKLTAFDATLGQVNIKTSNDAAVNFISWNLVDVATGTSLRSGSENRIDVNRNGSDEDVWADGLYFKVGGAGTILIKDHEYRLDLKFCGIGYDPITNQYPNSTDIAKSLELETSVTYYGLTEPQEYSPYKFVSISPDPATYEIDNINLRSFTMTWSGPVKPDKFIYAAMTGMTPSAGEFVAIEPNEDGYANAWEFTFAENVLTSSYGGFYASVSAKDANGLYVKGNADIDFDDIYYGMSWSCNLGATALTSVEPTDGATVTSLSSITVGNEKGLEMNLAHLTSETAKIYKDGRDLVATLGEPEQSADLTQYTWTFDEITEPGVYAIIIPKSYFNVGTEFNSTTANQTTFRYIIEGENAGGVADLIPVTVEPAENNNLTQLDKIVLTFDQVVLDGTFASDYQYSYANIYKKDADGEYALVEKVDGEFDDWDAPKVYTFTLSAPITEAGEYRVTIPEYTFVTTQYDDSFGENGSYSPELNYYYTIGEPDGVNGIAAEDGTVTVYDLVGRLLLDKAPAAEINSLSAGLYIINGKKTVIK